MDDESSNNDERWTMDDTKTPKAQGLKNNAGSQANAADRQSKPQARHFAFTREVEDTKQPVTTRRKLAKQPTVWAWNLNIEFEVWKNHQLKKLNKSVP